MDRDRILIRGLNWLGDAIMALPALQRLRQARPEAHIAILTPRKLADLWKPPLIDEVIAFDREESAWQISQRLRRGRYSTGIVLPMSFRSALELWLAGIPKRIGAEHKGRGPLLSHPVRKPHGILEMQKRPEAEILRLVASSTLRAPEQASRFSHHIYRYLSLVEALGADPTPISPHLAMNAEEVEAIHHRFLCDKEAGDAPFYGMCPGGEYGPTKRWPEERFVEAARRLHERTGCRWLLFGAPGETAACERIASAVREKGDTPIWNLAGQTSLREVAGLLKSCSLVMGNDSGPLHLAAAVGTPVAALFSSTSAVLTAPGLPGEPKHFIAVSTAACSPCYLRACPIDMRCMDSLTVERMVNGILELQEHSVSRLSRV